MTVAETLLAGWALLALIVLLLVVAVARRR